MNAGLCVYGSNVINFLSSDSRKNLTVTKLLPEVEGRVVKEKAFKSSASLTHPCISTCLPFFQGCGYYIITLANNATLLPSCVEDAYTGVCISDWAVWSLNLINGVTRLTEGYWSAHINLSTTFATSFALINAVFDYMLTRAIIT